MHVHFVISMVNAALSLQSIEGEMEETKKRHRTDLWRLSAMCPARQSSTIFGDCSIWIYCSESSKNPAAENKPFWDSLRYRPSVSWLSLQMSSTYSPSRASGALVHAGRSQIFRAVRFSARLWRTFSWSSGGSHGEIGMNTNNNKVCAIAQGLMELWYWLWIKTVGIDLVPNLWLKKNNPIRRLLGLTLDPMNLLSFLCFLPDHLKTCQAFTCFTRPVSIFDFCCGPALGATSHTCVFFQNRDAGKWSALHSGQAVRVDIPFQWCGFGFQRFTLERKPPIGGFTGPTCTAHLHAFPVVEHDQIILGWLSQQSQLVNFPGDKPSFSRLSSYPVYLYLIPISFNSHL